MKHLNESFLAVEEHIVEAIRKLGINCMGIDEDAVRREAMDELAMGLQCLKTGQEDELAERAPRRVADIVATDAQAKTAGSNARHGGAGNTSAPHGSNASPQRETLPNPEPFKVFQTDEELTEFVLGIVNGVDRSIHDAAVEKSKRDMREFRKKEALKRSLLCRGETIVEESHLAEAIEALEDALERLPGVIEPADGDDGLTEFIVKAYARVRVAWRCGTTRDDQDIDVSDNDRAESAQAAENSHERTDHAEALEEGAA